jgi:formamidopyrimidine-DNA glycosylase
MPELPEVETIARGLAPLLVGRRIEGIEVLDRRALPDGVRTFERHLAGRLVEDVTRRAKLCLVHAEGGGVMAFHLKMTGRLFVNRPDAVEDRHARLRISLEDGRALHFSDMRRFGSARIFGPGGIESWPFYRTLGPEPFEMDEAAFIAALSGRGARVKAMLLDQRVIAGVGNIYADEALFTARIRPDARAGDVLPDEAAALLRAVKDVMERAIAAGGSTIRDYRTAEGVEGSFQWSFAVYGRAGQPCPACGRGLSAVKVAGRTSTFCPRCQK